MLVEVTLNSPYPDFRFGARSHALLQNNLEVFIPGEKDHIRSKITNKIYNKISYYDSVIGVNHISNSQVVYNFKILGSKLFREFLKSIPGTYIESGTEFNEISDEFKVDGEFNKSCEFNLTINLYLLLQLLKYLEKNVKVFYNFYGIKFINSIDNAIKSQIRVPNVLSNIYSKASKIIEINDIFSGNIEKDKSCSLSELSEFNNSHNIKLLGLIEYINSIEDIESHSFSGVDSIPYELKELRFNGLKNELSEMCCSLNELSAGRYELLESYADNNEKLIQLFKCNLKSNKCKCKDKQKIKLVEQNKVCPILINKLNLYTENKLTNLIKKLIKEK